MGIKGSHMKKAYPQLELGMSKELVVSLLGTPDSTREGLDGVETLKWYTREFKGLLFGGFLERTISVEFKENTVISFEGNNINQL